MGREKNQRLKQAATASGSMPPGGGLAVDMSRRCCLPAGRDCSVAAPVCTSPLEPGAVRTTCSSGPSCPLSPWVHEACMEKLERFLLKKLKGTAVARNWSRTQVQANMWLPRWAAPRGKKPSCVSVCRVCVREWVREWVRA